MRIAKAINVYSITVPTSAPRRTSSFFDSPSYQTLYFRSREEAESHQKTYYASLSLHIDSKIAAEDKDEQGNDRWVLVNKVENMLESNHNKSLDRRNNYLQEVNYFASGLLTTVINTHPSSVIAVKKSNEERIAYPASHYWVSLETQIFYEMTDVIDTETRFLYVSGSERWFVEPGKSITLNVTPDLNLKSVIDANLSRLQELEADSASNMLKLQVVLAEQEKIQREQEQLQQQQVRLTGRKF